MTTSQEVAEPLLQVRDLVVSARSRGADIALVDGISLTVGRGEIVGLVGESGCGKSTTSNAIMRLFATPSVRQTAGEVRLDGTRIDTLRPGEMSKVRGARVAMIFQDPSTYLDPMMTVGRQVGEGLRVHRVPGDHDTRVVELLGLMGLPDPQGMMRRYPHEFSGGQRQRIGVARAIALRPKLVVCDEPVSALDVSIQAQVVNLLEDIQNEQNLAYVFIAHDLSVVRHISDRVVVMYLGKIMEEADRDELYESPLHPYTHALLSAVPVPDPKREERKQRILLKGDLPSPQNPPSGCVFRTRCPKVQERCAAEVPEPLELSPRHRVACHFPEERSVL